MDVAVYDRWGLKLDELDGAHSGWDGRTAAGVEVTDATCYYLFYAVGENRKGFKEKGFFMPVK